MCILFLKKAKKKKVKPERQYISQTKMLSYIHSAKNVLHTPGYLGYTIKTIMLMDMFYISHETTINTEWTGEN